MKMKIAVVFGGESVEHEISIISALQVMEAIDLSRYEVLPIYISKDGRMFYSDTLKNLSAYEDHDLLARGRNEIIFVRKNNHYYLQSVYKYFKSVKKEFDLVFPILHGTYGEDGCFQGYLKTLRIPYVGCSVLAAALGQDKVYMKQIMQEAALPITPWFHWEEEKALDNDFYRKAERLQYPLIIKPANLGSSIGIRCVHDEAELHHAMSEAFSYDRKVIVEKQVENLREFNCAVLGDEESVIASSIEEVKKQDEILSFQDKYMGSDASKGMVNTNREINSNLESNIKEEIEVLAKHCFHVIGASGVARIDFLYDSVNKQVYVNEINTIPGSLSYYLWEASGIGFTELIDRCIKIAKKAIRKNRSKTYSYDTNLLKLMDKGHNGLKKLH